MTKRAGTGAVPSMQNVAAYAGVSIATVSKVMQGDATVRPENVVAVQNAIEALGYRINPVAAELRRGRRKLIGVLVHSLDAITDAVVRAIERSAGRQGYTVWIGSSDGSEEREAELIGQLKDWRVAGCVVLPVREDSGSPAPVLLDGVPAVFIDTPALAGTVDVVLVEAAHAAATVRQRLADAAISRVLIVEKRQALPQRTRLRDALETELGRHRFENVMTLALDDDPAAAAAALASSLDAPGQRTAIVTLWRPAEFLVAAHRAARFRTDPIEVLLLPLRSAEPHAAAKGTVPFGAIEYPAELVGTAAIELLLRRLTEPTRPTLTQTASYSVTAIASAARQTQAVRRRKAL